MPDFFLDRAKVVRKYADGLLCQVKSLPVPQLWKSILSCRIYRDGTVRYAARKSFDIACNFNYWKVPHCFFLICVILCLQYPFDTHTCNVAIHSFSYTTSDYTLKVLHIRTSTS